MTSKVEPLPKSPSKAFPTSVDPSSLSDTMTSENMADSYFQKLLDLPVNSKGRSYWGLIILSGH
jgi:hypothetical protein